MFKFKRMMKPFILVATFVALLVPCVCLTMGLNNTTFVPITDDQSQTISAPCDDQSATYQWKIVNPEDGTSADIQGATDKDLTLNKALVQNMSDFSGTSRLVCCAYDNQGNEINSWRYVANQDNTNFDSTTNNDNKAADPKTSSLEKTDATNDDTYSVEVKFYKADSWEKIGDPFDQTSIANIEAGSPLNWKIELQCSIGYASQIRKDSGADAKLKAEFTDASNTYVQISTITDDGITDNYVFSVLFSPNEYTYYIQHKQENANDNNFTLHETTSNHGPVDSVIPTDSDFIPYEGFSSGAYESSMVNPRSPETVTINYNRLYYLSKFDAQGGINGQNALYAKYGSSYPEIATPTREGYEFQGWYDDKIEGNRIDFSTATVPAYSITYYAHWRVKSNTASINLVIWGQNAEDDNYTYQNTHQVKGLTVGSSYTPEKNYILGLTDKTCEIEGSTKPGTYSVRWKFNKCDQDVVVTADNKAVCNVYLDRLLFGWRFTKNNSATETNMKTIYDRWGKYIYDGCKQSTSKGAQIDISYHQICEWIWGTGSTQGYFKTTATDTTSTSLYTEIFYPNQKGISDAYAVSSSFDSTNLRYKGAASLPTYNPLNFYLEKLDSKNNSMFTSSDLTHEYKGDDFVLKYTKKNSSSDTTWGDPTSLTAMTGFKTPDKPSSSKANGYRPYTLKVGTSQTCLNVFYKRASYNINLKYDSNTPITEITIDPVKFEQLFENVEYKDTKGGSGKLINYVPTAPDTVDKNYVFDCWCTDPECNAPFSWDAVKTMPANELNLYAKWVPASNKINFYTNQSDIGQEDPHWTVKEQTYTQIIPEDQRPPDPEKKDCSFRGWFYTINGVEKAFDPTTMPIDISMEEKSNISDRNPINFYAKWNSTEVVSYKVLYKLGSPGDDPDKAKDVSPERKGATYKDTTINVYAKTGIELDVGYKDSYMPHTDSVELTITDDSDNTVVFWYRQGNFKYTVNHYLENDDGTRSLYNSSEGYTSKSMLTVSQLSNVKDAQGNIYTSTDTQITINIKQDETKNVVDFVYKKIAQGDAVCIIHNYIYNGEPYDHDNVTLNSSTQINKKIYEYVDPVPETISGYKYNDGQPEYTGKIQLKDPVTVINYYYGLENFAYKAIATDKIGRTIDILPTKSGSAVYKSLIGHEVFSGEAFNKVFTAQDPADYFTVDYLESSNTHEFVYVENNAEFVYSVNNSDYGNIDSEGQSLGSYTGNAAKVTATAKAGHAFVKWIDEDGLTVSPSPSFTPSKIHDKDTGLDYYVSAKYQAVFASAWGMLQIAASGETINSNEFFDVTDTNGTRTISLKEDIDCFEQDLSQIVVPADKNIVINLNGYDINRNATDDVLENGRVISNSGNLTINGKSDGATGSITGGNCTGDGGGILNSGTLTLNNCTVASNTSSANGDNIANKRTLNVSGKTVVSDNNKSNVYLPSNSLINVSGSLSAGSMIGVTVANAPSGGTPVQISGCNVSNSQYFKSDNSNYVITTLNKESGLYLDAYEAQNGEIALYNGVITVTSIQIPYTINGVNTTGLKAEVFSSKPSLESISIPDALTKIESAAFAGSRNLKNFTVDANNNAYKACETNDAILLSEDGTTLVSYPSATGDVVIPSTITVIDANAFKSCSDITSVTFEGETRPTGIEQLAILPVPIYYYPSKSWCDSEKPSGSATWNPRIKTDVHLVNYLTSQNCSNEKLGTVVNNFEITGSRVIESQYDKELDFNNKSITFGNNLIKITANSLTIKKGTITGHSVLKTNMLASSNNNAVPSPYVSAKEPEADNTSLLTATSNDDPAQDKYALFNTPEGSLTLSNMIVTDNTVKYSCVYNKGTLTVTDSNCSFDKNKSTYKGFDYARGGSCIYNSGRATVTGASFTNSSGYCGGAINNIGTMTVDKCSFTGNSAVYGGAIFNSMYDNTSSITIENSTITDNTAKRDKYMNYQSGGGLLNIYGNTAIFKGKVIITDNKSQGNADNVCLGKETYITFDDSSFSSESNIGISIENPITLPVVVSQIAPNFNCCHSDLGKYQIAIEEDKLVIKNAASTNGTSAITGLH